MPRCPCAYFLIALLALANPSAAFGCSFVPLSYEDQFAEASAVFVARIVRTEEGKGSDPTRIGIKPETIAVVEATFRIVEILKGQPPGDGKVRSLRSEEANCTIPLLAAQDYLFFLSTDGFVWGPSGSGIVNPDGKDRDLLERLRKLARDAR